MADGAMLGLLYDAVDSVASFVQVFVTVYSLLILAYIITSWVRLPYSPWLNRIQRFLYDVCDPYLRLWRRDPADLRAARPLARDRRGGALHPLRIILEHPQPLALKGGEHDPYSR